MSITTKKCACACGTDIPLRNVNGEIFYAHGHHWRGRKRIGEIREQQGAKNNNWRGGRIITSEGYVKVRAEGHHRATTRGHYVLEHRLIKEKELGRLLNDDEVVHHKNHIKDENKNENLAVLSWRDHSSIHRKEDIARGKPLFGRSP